MATDRPVTPSELTGFLAGETGVEGFGHAEHVRMAHATLATREFLAAAQAYSAALGAMLARAGQEDAFHLTTTIAFLSLISERMARDEDWPAFLAANRDLLDKRVLSRRYSSERLATPLARTRFLLPDRLDPVAA